MVHAEEALLHPPGVGLNRLAVSLLVLIAALVAAGPGYAPPPARPDALSPDNPSIRRSADGDTVYVSLAATAQSMSLIPGVETPAYAYNGQVPGPTLEFREGDRVVVRFRNDLPEVTTVHWHGLNLPFDADGSPFHLVAPGEEYTYAFTVRPGAAGTYWYHPHPNHSTGWQVGMGLFGTVIVRADDDPLAGLPERVLTLWDNKFLDDGSIAVHERGTSIQGTIDFENGREGDVLFVSGEVMPELSIRPGEVQHRTGSFPARRCAHT